MLAKLKTLWKDRRGNALLIMGSTMPVLIGFAGLATDTVQWTLDKRDLQRTADSAALAGAFALAQDSDLETRVETDIARSSAIVLSADPLIENAPTSGPNVGDDSAVSVTLTTQRQMPFSQLFMIGAPEITVRATAKLVSNGAYCVISLRDDATAGIQTGGSAEVDMNCGFFSNSRGGSAVDASGSSDIDVTVVGAVGGITETSNYASGTQFIPYGLSQPDPFEDLPLPAPSGCGGKLTVNSNQTRTINPGCYAGMDLKGTVTMNPGTYYINGGSLSFGAQARVTGNGVTFVLTSTTAATNPSSIATLDMNGGATVNLRAPTTGTFAGVLMYQDPRANSTASNGSTIVNKLNGNSASLLQGGFYFPKQKLEYTGNSGVNTDCVQFVAYEVKFWGNSEISNICPYDTSVDFFGTVVRLTE